ncbi:MAG: ethanolamine utilization protein EutH [Patescibacteria group bacterium]|jgi:ethanolamine transporter
MDINQIIIYILVFFMALGALDKCIGNKFGLGEKFDDGFKIMGPLAIAMVGIISLAPVLAKLLGPVIGPVYSFFGADPAMFAGTLLAVDMGGYQLAVQMAKTVDVGLFSGIILGSMMGATIVFTIPVALGMIRKEDHRFLAIGVLAGLATIPFGCLIGGLLAGFSLKMILINLVPVVIFAALVIIGLWFFQEKIIKLFHWFSKFIMIVITIGTAAIIIETLTGLVVIPGMAPIWDGIRIVGYGAIILMGAFPMIYVITKALKKPLLKLGHFLGINEVAASGMVISLCNNIPAISLTKDMDDKGKVLNFAFGVSAAFIFGEQLGLVASVNQSMIFPMIIGKLSAGILAVALAYWLVSRTDILKAK